MLWQLKHQILAARPVVSDKGPDPLALQKRIPTKMESSKTSKVLMKGETYTVYVDRHMGRLRESPSVTPLWQLELLF